MMTYLLLIAGFVILVFGGDLLVRGSVAVARRLGMSELAIGITLVGFGTSAPELVTSIQAALAGSPGIAVGNVVGSNIANILLILGIAAIIYPVICDPAALKRDGIMLIIATLMLGVAVWMGDVNRIMGLVFLLLLVGYVVFVYRKERTSHDPSAELHRDEAHLVEETPGMNIWLALGMSAIGIGLTVLGARFLVDSSIEIATRFGISDAVIGLTIVAVGTSLPELVTSVMASLRKSSDVALGNVVGSNIYNILCILGVTALIKPLEMPEEIIRQDFWIMAAATILLLIFAYTRSKIERWEGWVFLSAYAGYIGWLAMTA